MRKIYMKPETELMVIDCEHTLLAASDSLDKKGDYGDDVEILSKKNNFSIWDDEE